ncbi:hypothetical protein TRVA0_001S06744 [Trichomonascus vanleenenianus]|uniref:uncharacterized protein n=1 Tax=Trichomonascus vanleenenianus TaxID=2268995 RepID=UPI003ECAC66E
MRFASSDRAPSEALDEEALSKKFGFYRIHNNPQAIRDREGRFDHSKYAVQATMALVLVKMSKHVYKFLKDEPGLRRPDVQPCYNLVYNESLSHAYSLLKDYSGVPRDEPRPYVLRPFFTYTTPSKLITHGTIFDLTTYAATEEGFSEYSVHASEPLSVRVVFGDKMPGMEYPTVIARTSSDTEYIWSYSQYPLDSRRYVYLMSMSDVKTRGVEIPVAVVAEAHYFSPVDGSPLESIYIDAERVHPGLAALTYFATVHWRKHIRINSWKMGTMVRNPKILNKIVFEGEGDEVHQSGEHLLDDINKIFSDISTEPEQLTKIEDIIAVKVFNGNYLRQYDIPLDVLEWLNRVAGDKILALKSFYCLDMFLGI